MAINMNRFVLFRELHLHLNKSFRLDDELDIANPIFRTEVTMLVPACTLNFQNALVSLSAFHSLPKVLKCDQCSHL